MQIFNVEIKGTTPLLQHRMTDDQLFSLLGAKGEKKKVDTVETPREIAEKYAYKDKNQQFVIPRAYLVGAFKHVASDYKQKNTARKSYKTIAAGIFRPNEEFSTLLDFKDKPITDFEVDIKKATNHLKGAVAVCRPRFDQWKCKFTVSVDDEIIAPSVALEILQDAGKRAGIGSYRVAKGGYFGQFQVVSWKKSKASV